MNNGSISPSRFVPGFVQTALTTAGAAILSGANVVSSAQLPKTSDLKECVQIIHETGTDWYLIQYFKDGLGIDSGKCGYGALVECKNHKGEQDSGVLYDQNVDYFWNIFKNAP